MAEFKDEPTYCDFYLPGLVNEELRKALRDLVALAFEEKPQEAMALLSDIMGKATPEQAASFNAGPVYTALLEKIATALGDAQTAGQMKAETQRRGGNPVWCLNDLISLLAERGDYDAAIPLFLDLLKQDPNNTAVVANLFSTAVQSADDATSRMALSALCNQIDQIAGMIEAGAKPGGDPFKRLSLSIVLAVFGALVRWMRRDASALTTGTSDLIGRLLAIIGALPDMDRDTYLSAILRGVRWDKDSAVKVLETGSVEPSHCLGLLRAALAFDRCDEDAEQRLQLLADKDTGRILPLALAFIAGEQGDLATERKLIEQLIEREPENSRSWFHLASNLFRSGDRSGADDAAQKSINLSRMAMNEMIDTATRQAGYLKTAVDSGIPERWPEIDPYADIAWAKNYWEKYLFDFEHLTYRQDSSVFVNKAYVDGIKLLLERDPTVKTVFNFGAFCGEPDYRLAIDHPDVTFIGFDRDSNAIAESAARFIAPNLRFEARDLEDSLSRIGRDGKSVMVHIRTCTTLFPEGVRRVYAKAASAGIDYILGVETTGYSFQTQSYPDFSDPSQPPVVPLGVMVDHNYPVLLGEAGYSGFEETLMVYPFLTTIAWNPEAQTPRRFLAWRD